MHLWTQIPEAAVLLAELGANPPSRRWAHVADTLSGPVHGWRYSRRDERVKRLEEIHEAEWERLIAAYDAGEIEREIAAAHLGVTPDVAIEEAMRVAKAAPELARAA